MASLRCLSEGESPLADRLERQLHKLSIWPTESYRCIPSLTVTAFQFYRSVPIISVTKCPKSVPHSSVNIFRTVWPAVRIPMRLIAGPASTVDGTRTSSWILYREYNVKDLYLRSRRLVGVYSIHGDPRAIRRVIDWIGTRSATAGCRAGSTSVSA